MTGEPVPQSPPRFRVAIIGGGIAGLTLAVALGHFDRNRGSAAAPLEVHIYESGPEITTVGAGISVWPRTWTVMRALGLYEDLARASVQPLASTSENGQSEFRPAFVFRKSDQPREGYEFGRTMVPNGSTTMHRADMVDVLVKHLPPSCTIHTSKRLLSYTATDASGTLVYTLHFADGTTVETDVLVGGDGIKSKVRAAMYDCAHARDCAQHSKRDECERCAKATPKWTGTVGYRFLIPKERMREVNPEHHALKVTAPMSYSGKEKHIITYPISHGKYLNWIGFVTIRGGEGTTFPHKWVVDAQQEEVTAHFGGWEPEVEQMLKLVEKPTLWAIHVVENLPFAVDGCVALMGDAVHAMTTHFGAGGGQAIEDAFVLGRLLADPHITLPLVPAAFQIYQDVRLPFARTVVNNARKAGLMYEFSCPGLYNGSPLNREGKDAGDQSENTVAEERKQLSELSEAIQEIWQWQWKERVEDQWGEVDRRLEQLTKAKRGVIAASDVEKGKSAKVPRRHSNKCTVM